MSFTAKGNPILITALSCHVSFNKEHSGVFRLHDIDIVEENSPQFGFVQVSRARIKFRISEKEYKRGEAEFSESGHTAD
jgi:hypothetical protein